MNCIFDFKVALAVPSLQKLKSNEKVPHMVYQVPFTPEFVDTFIRLEIEGHKLHAFMKGREVLSALCESALNSTQLLEELRSFDLIVYDGTVAMCAPLVGEFLDIPRVELLVAAPNVPFGFNRMIPMPVSYVPQLMLGFTDKMSFVERVVNLMGYLGGKLFMKLAIDNIMDGLKVKYNIKPQRSYQEAVGNSELVIIAADFALEYPQPLLPGMNNNNNNNLICTQN